MWYLLVSIFRDGGWIDPSIIDHPSNPSPLIEGASALKEIDASRSWGDGRLGFFLLGKKIIPKLGGMEIAMPEMEGDGGPQLVKV